MLVVGVSMVGRTFLSCKRERERSIIIKRERERTVKNDDPARTNFKCETVYGNK